MITRKSVGIVIGVAALGLAIVGYTSCVRRHDDVVWSDLASNRLPVSQPLTLERPGIPLSRKHNMKLLDAVSSSLYENIEGSVSGVIHGMHVWGPNMSLNNHLTALNTLTSSRDSEAYFGRPALFRTTYGLRNRTVIRRDADRQPERQAHIGQLLAILAEHGVPLSTVVDIDGTHMAVSDILSDTIAMFDLDRELEWNAFSMVTYLAPSGVVSWRNRYDERFTFDSVAKELLNRELEREDVSCYGAHVVQTLVVMIRAHETYGILSESVAQQVRLRVAEWRRLVVSGVMAEGGCKVRWFSPHRANPRYVDIERERIERIGVTAHAIEWLCVCDELTSNEQEALVRAAEWLQEQLSDINGAQIEQHMCPISHALYVLLNLCKIGVDRPGDVANALSGGCNSVVGTCVIRRDYKILCNEVTKGRSFGDLPSPCDSTAHRADSVLRHVTLNGSESWR